MPFRHARSAAVLARRLAADRGRADDTTTHRNGFGDRNPYFARGEANVRFEEKLHKISDEHARNAPTSEQIRIEANPPGGAEEAQFVHYVYPIPPAPVSPRLNAGLWLKAYRPGVQLRARVVFPKERDPKNPDAPLTSLIVGDTYRNVRSWEPLTLGNVPEVVRQHMPVLHARLGRAVDPTDAYLDQLILNVYAGPGVTDLWVDDLSVGPVRAGVPAAVAKAPELPAGVPTGRAGDRPPPQTRAVRFADSQIKIDDDPFFMLAVRHSNTPLKTLRDANLNTVWFPPDASPETIDEAVRQGFWIVPQLPVPADGWDGERSPRMDEVAAEAEAAQLAVAPAAVPGRGRGPHVEPRRRADGRGTRPGQAGGRGPRPGPPEAAPGGRLVGRVRTILVLRRRRRHPPVAVVHQPGTVPVQGLAGPAAVADVA